jgi:uncharacterized membrane-anchored protein
MNKYIFILFAAMCIAQWVVPGMMIADSESVISEGKEFKFKTEPIDPSDPFRGKYITLRFEADNMELEGTVEFQTGQKIFVTFEEDSAGFAVPSGIYKTEPETPYYLETKIAYVSSHRDHRVHFDLPFNRFYLEESKALKAEELYREAQRDSMQVAYALVNLGAGQAVIKDVILNNRPILDLINESNTSP